MRVFFHVDDQEIMLMASIITPHAIGDWRDVMVPGGTIFGLTYDELLAKRAGAFEVDDKGQGRWVEIESLESRMESW